MCSSSAHNPYSGVTRFESWPGQMLSWLRFLGRDRCYPDSGFLAGTDAILTQVSWPGQMLFWQVSWPGKMLSWLKFLGRDKCYPDSGFSWRSSTSPGKHRDSISSQIPFYFISLITKRCAVYLLTNAYATIEAWYSLLVFHRVQTGPGAHPIGAEGFFSGG
jgi:hypothetical protein